MDAQVIFLGYTSYARDLRADGQRETQEQARRRVAVRARAMIMDITKRDTIPLLLSPSFLGPPLGPGDAARMLRGTRGGGVAFHHLVLSPHPRIPLAARPAYEVYTCAALETLRRRKCYPRLVWMAAHHTDTTHPHVHVLLLGYQPRRYGERPLVLVPGDAHAMGTTVAAWCHPVLPAEHTSPRCDAMTLILPAPLRSFTSEGNTDTDGDGP